jgi:hypothetical protein
MTDVGAPGPGCRRCGKPQTLRTPGAPAPPGGGG